MAHVISNMNIRSSLDFAMRQSDWIDAQALTAGGAAVTIQAPAGAKYVLFSCNGDFYCRITATSVGAAVVAVVPAAVTDGSAPELNPSFRMLPESQSYISMISPASGGTIVTLHYFKE